MSEVVDNDLLQLAQCAREGRHEEAEALLPFASPCAFTSAATSWTALHIAAYYGRLRVLRVFLRFICDSGRQDQPPNGARLSVDVRDRIGSTPLNCAAYAGRLTAARMLLSAGARVDLVDCDGDVPAVSAAYYGHPDLVQLLLSRGQPTTPECARRALADALGFAQCWKTAQAVLRVCPYAARDGTAATTALLTICRACPPHTESPLRMVRLLWKMGADVDAADENGYTPLHFAAQCGWVDVVSFLLHTCKTSAINRLDSSKNNSPLSLACGFAGQAQRSALVRKLLRHGANPNAPHKNCLVSPMTAAARQMQVDIARTLIDSGARMEVERFHRREVPPLLAAAFHKSRAHLKWFAKTFDGIMGSLSDSDGHSVFHAAAQTGDVGIMKLVVRLGANPNRLANDGRSALHTCVAGFSASEEADIHGRLCEDIVEYLVKIRGLNPDQKSDLLGYSPLHKAAINDRCAEVTRALIKHGATVDSRCAKGMYCC
jgi:ankyrin repeat protein